MPPHQLAAVLPEREFISLQRYAARKMLPQRRLELYLAQLALLVAQSGGAKDVTLQDFLFDLREEEPTEDEAEEFFGGWERVK
jgi:hypothetical protein